VGHLLLAPSVNRSGKVSRILESLSILRVDLRSGEIASFVIRFLPSLLTRRWQLDEWRTPSDIAETLRPFCVTRAMN
jgi:hypothetical protein